MDGYDSSDSVKETEDDYNYFDTNVPLFDDEVEPVYD